MERVIIGITGPAASGKSTIAEALKEKGFTYFLLSDEIRKEAEKRKWSTTDRKVLQDLGDELRLNFGYGVLAERVVRLEEFKHADLVVIDSIRHPSEISYLREFFDAKIIGVTASSEKLFELIVQRGRDGDPKTFDDFLKMQERELATDIHSDKKKESNVMNIKECLKSADILILNEGTKLDLRKEVDKELQRLGIEGGSMGHERHRNHH